MAAIRGLAEIVLMVDDVERSVAFYRDALGLTVISPDLQGPVFLRVGERSSGVPQQIVLVPRPPAAPEQPAERAFRSVHHFGLEVEEGAFEREWERLGALGFEVRTGVHPFLPVETIYVDDPDGNEVELVTARGPVASGGGTSR
jgi:catechol 2,3-dioxygenase-like lactoylglutathione lyase family enzyme